MKSVFLVLTMLVTSFFVKAQGILPDTSLSQGAFTEWQKVTTKVDGAEATYEYRIAFNGKNGQACHYELQVKNTYSKDLNFKIDYSYTHNDAKKSYSIEGHAKAGKDMDGELLVQGCKMGNSAEKSDLENCKTCDFAYAITVSPFEGKVSKK